MKYRTFVILLIVGSFLFLELFMRIKGGQNTYTESIGKGYSSYYNTSHKGWYHTWSPQDSFTLDHGDFKFPYKINSLGMREKEVVNEKPDSVFRIITMGDSYTEGVGAPFDSTWPRLIETKLNVIRMVEVINAGESGNDPFYDFMFYRDKLKDVSADMVIVAMNASDFTDYILRGGMERFHSDSTTYSRKGPWYEPFYQHSHFLRALMQRFKKYPYKGIFVTPEELEKMRESAVVEYVELFREFNEVAKSRGTKFVLVVYPIPTEIVFDNEENRHSKMAMQKIASDMEADEVTTINLWPSFLQIFSKYPEQKYTYEHDKHYNAFGYNIMAEEIAKNLLEAIDTADVNYGSAN